MFCNVCPRTWVWEGNIKALFVVHLQNVTHFLAVTIIFVVLSYFSCAFSYFRIVFVRVEYRPTASIRGLFKMCIIVLSKYYSRYVTVWVREYIWLITCNSCLNSFDIEIIIWLVLCMCVTNTRWSSPYAR